jgi:hypothetical protein
MTPEQEHATRALFEGDRAQVERLLRDRAQTPYEWWLLACAVEDERERTALLRRVHQSGEQPYADLAWTILQREAQFAAQLAAWRMVDESARLAAVRLPDRDLRRRLRAGAPAQSVSLLCNCITELTQFA